MLREDEEAIGRKEEGNTKRLLLALFLHKLQGDIVLPNG